MEKRAIAFTDKGRCVIERLSKEYKKRGMEEVTSYDSSLSVDDFISRGFEDKACLIFVCAVGIAVRYISKYINDKLTDSPVIVIDDNAQFVIPLVSGHVGGANKAALTIAELLEAVPVITTSTDINDVFSPDLYAVENWLNYLIDEDVLQFGRGELVGTHIFESHEVFLSARTIYHQDILRHILGLNIPVGYLVVFVVINVCQQASKNSHSDSQHT